MDGQEEFWGRAWMENSWQPLLSANCSIHLPLSRSSPQPGQKTAIRDEYLNFASLLLNAPSNKCEELFLDGKKKIAYICEERRLTYIGNVPCARYQASNSFELLTGSARSILFGIMLDFYSVFTT